MTKLVVSIKENPNRTERRFSYELRLNVKEPSRFNLWRIGMGSGYKTPEKAYMNAQKSVKRIASLSQDSIKNSQWNLLGGDFIVEDRDKFILPIYPFVLMEKQTDSVQSELRIGYQFDGAILARDGFHYPCNVYGDLIVSNLPLGFPCTSKEEFDNKVEALKSHCLSFFIELEKSVL